MTTKGYQPIPLLFHEYSIHPFIFHLDPQQNPLDITIKGNLWVNNNVLRVYDSTILCPIPSSKIAIMSHCIPIYTYSHLLITSPFTRDETHIFTLKPPLFKDVRSLFTCFPINITFSQRFVHSKTSFFHGPPALHI